MSDSREAVLRAATRLFAERGYSSVSVRDIAAAAGVSPALVMKLGGSKDELFRRSIEFTPEDLDLTVSDADLPRMLVDRVLDRAEALSSEPLVRAVILVLPAPDPEVVREAFAAAYIDRLTTRLGGDPAARTRAELGIAALVGLAVSLRIFRRPADLAACRDTIAESYESALRGLLFP